MTARHPISDLNVLIIGICNFDIVCNLSIVIWDFSAVSGKANRFYLNKLELTLTFPCLSSLKALTPYRVSVIPYPFERNPIL